MEANPLPVMAPAIPELFLAVAGMALLMIGVFRGGPRIMTEIAYMTVGVFAVTAILVLIYGGTSAEPVFFDLFAVGPFAQFTKILILGGSGLAIVMSLDWLKAERVDRFEFPVLVLFATLGMMMMVSANDLIALYVGLELQSLSLYVVASIQRDSLRSTEAGLKYFVLGALSSGMLLYGCSLIYGFAGTTEFAKLAEVFGALGPAGPSIGLLFGIVFLIAGLAFKISAVPFHMWTPDVYEGAPTPVTALFAVAPKVAAVSLFLQTMIGPFMELKDEWQQILSVVAILSMALGALAAIVQTNIKRLMAYSSIGHMGYLLVGIAAANEQGVMGVLVYLAVYLFMNVGMFACILSMRQGGRAVERIEDLAGLSKTNPAMALALLVFLFSMAGIPPLAGFFGKYYVFAAAVAEGLYILAVVGILTSVIGAFYYLRIVKVMYFDEAVEPLDRAMAPVQRWVMLVSGVITLFFFAVPGPIVDMAQAAAKTLLG